MEEEPERRSKGSREVVRLQSGLKSTPLCVRSRDGGETQLCSYLKVTLPSLRYLKQPSLEIPTHPNFAMQVSIQATCLNDAYAEFKVCIIMHHKFLHAFLHTGAKMHAKMQYIGGNRFAKMFKLDKIA